MRRCCKLSNVLLVLGLIACLFVGIGSDGCEVEEESVDEVIEVTSGESEGEETESLIVYYEGRLRDVVIENGRICFDLDRNTVLILKIHESGEALVYGQAFELGEIYRIGVDDVYLESIEALGSPDGLFDTYGIS